MFVLNVSPIDGLPLPPYNASTGRTLGPQRPDNYGRPQIITKDSEPDDTSLNELLGGNRQACDDVRVAVPIELPWNQIDEFARAHLPYHESLMTNVGGRETPLKYTIKKNSKEIEMIAASATFHGVKSRIIFHFSRKIGFIDFTRRNLRTWIVNGELALRPFIETKPYPLKALKGFYKLANLHLEKYLIIFKQVFGI